MATAHRRRDAARAHRRAGGPLSAQVDFDRAAGVVVAAACADALGAGYEFAKPVPADQPVEMCGRGAFGPGEWTDDTAQMVAIALAVAEGHDITTPAGEDAVAINFRDWYWSPAARKDIGMHTSVVLSAVSSAPDDGLGERLRSEAAAKEHRSPGTSGGNGALMRTGAVAVALHADPMAMTSTAMRLASMTHADDRSTESCVVWCLAIRRAMQEGLPWDLARLAQLQRHVIDDVRHYLPDSAEYWAEVLTSSWGTSPADYYDYEPRNGYCVTSLRAAWAAVTSTAIPDDVPSRHLRLATEAAVRCGGDTDTVACIAGALLGAMWGYSAVPLPWRRIVHGWPAFRDADLLRVADAVVRGGRVESTQWPNADRIDYSAQPGLDALAVHPFDDGVVMSGISAGRGEVPMPGGPVDAIVSLCRVGRTEVAALGVADEDRADVRLIDTADRRDNPNLELVLTDAADMVAAFRREGKRVLLHCVAAQSRTPAVAAMYAIRHLNVEPSAALAAVVAALPDATPNEAFRAVVLASP